MKLIFELNRIESNPLNNPLQYIYIYIICYLSQRASQPVTVLVSRYTGFTMIVAKETRVLPEEEKKVGFVRALLIRLL